jgi:NADPH:quinone reductase-like Zn-dependent oxidoreductase
MMQSTRAVVTTLVASLSVAAQAATPARMQAIVQTGNGGPEVLRLQTVDVPQPGAGQILIRVYAAAVNPIDWKERERASNPPPGVVAPPPGPKIPGLDVAGVVAAIGTGVSGFKVGQPVFSMIGRSAVLNGGYAEYALAPVANVAAKPTTLTYAQASGLGNAGMTAQIAVDEAGVKAGQRVLITGVAGGVGSSAAQIVKARGAYVIGTASARHAAYLRSIGVDEVIDYTQGNVADQVRNVDVVVDTVGGATAEQSFASLKQGGTFVSVTARSLREKCMPGYVCPPGRGPGVGEGEALHVLGALAAAGKFTVNVDQVYPLAQAAAAQEANRDGHTEGKIVIAVNAAQANRR